MKPQSYFFIFFLALIGIFIIGVRYGQKVEYENKKFNYTLSITPVQITTTPLPIDTFIDHTLLNHKDCGVSFLYPKILVKEKNSSTGAKLNTPDSTEGRITFSCSTTKTRFEQDLKVIKDTTTMKFQGKDMDIYRSGDFLSFITYNSLNKKYILFKIDSKLYSLVDKTLEYTR